MTGIGKTGVVGIFKNGDGPTVMYRADMDCNPVKEITGFSHASTRTVKKEDGTFYGVGAHGASPQYSKDPILMACNAVLQYQTIISRNMPAQDAAVLTVGAIQAGSDNNVIPASAVLKISIRRFDEKTRNILLDGIKRINEGIAVANGQLHCLRN